MRPRPPFRYVHLFFGGFTQRMCRPGNGVYGLFDEIYRLYACRDTLVLYLPWYAGAEQMAACLQELQRERLAEEAQPVRLQIAGYSFGGYTAVRVCRGLVGTGVAVDRLCLCDPVARRFGRFGWLRAVNPWTTIRVPALVHKCRVIRQRNPRIQLCPPWFHPAGHRVLATRGTHLPPPYDLTAMHGHLTIDNSQLFRDLVHDDAHAIHAVDRGPRDLAAADYLDNAA